MSEKDQSDMKGRNFPRKKALKEQEALLIPFFVYTQYRI